MSIIGDGHVVAKFRTNICYYCSLRHRFLVCALTICLKLCTTNFSRDFTAFANNQLERERRKRRRQTFKLFTSHSTRYRLQYSSKFYGRYFCIKRARQALVSSCSSAPYPTVQFRCEFSGVSFLLSFQSSVSERAQINWFASNWFQSCILTREIVQRGSIFLGFTTNK